MELLKNHCSNCRTPKFTTISFTASCSECGLDSREISYRIPPEQLDDLIHDISALLETHRAQPVDDHIEILSYEELLMRLEA